MDEYTKMSHEHAVAAIAEDRFKDQIVPVPIKDAKMMTKAKAQELGLVPFVKIVPRGMATAGVEPYEMGIGPVPATKKALERTGMSIDQIDLVELIWGIRSACPERG